MEVKMEAEMEIEAEKENKKKLPHSKLPLPPPSEYSVEEFLGIKVKNNVSKN